MKAKEIITKYCTENNIGDNRELIDDEVIEVMEDYATQRAISELEKVVINMLNNIGSEHVLHLLKERIKELKQ